MPDLGPETPATAGRLGSGYDAGLIEEAVTFLFVPGMRADRYEKAVASGADMVILDLEDAVSPEDKVIARECAAAWLREGGRAAVRINGIGTPWFAEDLVAVRDAAAIVLPKTEGGQDVDEVVAAGVGIPVIALVETARGILAAEDISAHPQVVRTAFGNVDLAADLGIDQTCRPALAAGRSHLVLAARAAGRAAPIDGVTTAILDTEALVSDAIHAREFGFTGKLLIHPSQVRPAAEAFLPTAAEISWANGVVAAAHRGVGVHDGQMVDAPVFARARQILGRARRAAG